MVPGSDSFGSSRCPGVEVISTAAVHANHSLRTVHLSPVASCTADTWVRTFAYLSKVLQNSVV